MLSQMLDQIAFGIWHWNVAIPTVQRGYTQHISSYFNLANSNLDNSNLANYTLSNLANSNLSDSNDSNLVT
jgi:hypothetical protein